MYRSAIASLCLFLAAGAVEAAPATAQRTAFCAFIESAAADHGIPVEFFTRLLWHESSFRASAVSPKGAQGIAQFMPATAAERGLLDPFDPAEAIPASARLLRDLTIRFGNLGLAAAAYNAGPRRLSEWLLGARELPWETRNYVAAVTGRPVEDWSSDAPPVATAETEGKGARTCLEYVALLAVPPVVSSPSPRPEYQPWGVQLAVAFSQERALASYRGLQKRHAAILGDREPLVLRRKNLSRGTKPVVQVRVPAPTREAANALCRELRQAGGACMVLRN